MSAVHALLGIIALLFLTVPAGKTWHFYPDNMTFALGCSDSNSDYLNSASHSLTDFDSNPCQVQPNWIRGNLNNFSVLLEECGYVCYDQPSDGIKEVIEPNQSLPIVAVKNVVLPKMEFREAVFFPNFWNLDMTCSPTRIGQDVCVLNRQNNASETSTAVNTTLGLDFFSESVNAKGSFPVTWMIMEDGVNSGQKKKNFQCGTYGADEKLHQTVYFKDSNQAGNNRAVYQFCRPQCIVRINRFDLCSDMVREDVFNPQLTFWLYMGLRLIFDIVLGGLDLFVGASVALVSKLGGDYGFQRMFGYIGIAVFSPISGILIDQFSEDDSILGNTR